MKYSIWIGDVHSRCLPDCNELKLKHLATFRPTKTTQNFTILLQLLRSIQWFFLTQAILKTLSQQDNMKASKEEGRKSSWPAFVETYDRQQRQSWLYMFNVLRNLWAYGHRNRIFFSKKSSAPLENISSAICFANSTYSLYYAR